MTTYDAQKLHDSLFGQYAGEDVQKKIQEFLELHDLERAHALAEEQRVWAKETYDKDVYVDEMTYGRLKEQADLIDPLAMLLEEHDWDETVFGGFLCETCTPDDPGWDEAVPWPCPPLRAAGFTDEMAVGIIKAHRAKIEAEHKAKKEGS